MGAHLVVRHGSQSRTIPIPEDRPFRVGRGDPDADVRINEPSISRIHAQFEKHSDGWYLTDLKSRNGTSVNGNRIRRVRLRSGDEVVFGRFRVTFDAGGKDAAASSPPKKAESRKRTTQAAASVPEAIPVRRPSPSSRPAPAAAEPAPGAEETPVPVAQPAAAAPTAKPVIPAAAPEEESDTPPPGPDADLDAPTPAPVARPTATPVPVPDVETDTPVPEDMPAEPPAPGPDAASEATPTPARAPEPAPDAAASATPAISRPRPVLRLIALGSGAVAACILAAVLYRQIGSPRHAAPDRVPGEPGTASTGDGTAGGGSDPAAASEPGKPPRSDGSPDPSQMDLDVPSKGDDGRKHADGEEPDPAVEAKSEPKDPSGTTSGGTPGVAVSAQGPWSEVELAFFDFGRQVRGLDPGRVAEVKQAIASLGDDRPQNVSAIRTWLSKPDPEWRFAAGKAAGLLKEESLASPLLQAAKDSTSALEGGKASGAPAEKALDVLASALQPVATLSMVPDLLAAGAGDHGTWAVYPMRGLRSRYPDELNQAIQAQALKASREDLGRILAFVGKLDAWGGELKTALLDAGLQSGDPAVRTRFAQACEDLQIQESKDLLFRMMKSEKDPGVRQAIQTALVRMGLIDRRTEVGQLASLFLQGNLEDTKRAYRTLEATGQIAEARRNMGPGGNSAAAAFLKALAEEGRERLLTDSYHPDSPYLAGGRDRAFEQQLKDEKALADYAGLWEDHVWLFESSIAIGLKPRNPDVIDVMNRDTPNERGIPGWLTNGPIIVLKPDKGEWKVAGLNRMDYAYTVGKMVRRQKDE